MCGRFYIEVDPREVQQMVEQLQRAQSAEAEQLTIRIEGEIFPTNVVAVRTASGPAPMKWGFEFTNRDGKKTQIINARSETALEKPLFRTAMVERRCVIPATGYYEWKPEPGKTRKTKYAFFLPDNAPIYFAGCYRKEKDVPVESFVLLTRAPTAELARFHDRMPVIFTKEQADAWLGADANLTELIDGSVTGFAYEEAQN
jgi:putative SOS response-associated peptidase YedK